MSLEAFERLHEQGMLTSQAHHPDRPDDWTPDAEIACTEHSLDQDNTRAGYDQWGWPVHDGDLAPGGFASDPLG